LLQTRALLEDVAVLSDPRGVKAPEITRLNARYSASLSLAELVLQSTSLNAERGEVSAASFVFDMNEVFESFLTLALEDALRPFGGWLRAQYTTTLDKDNRVRLKPDVTWWLEGRCRVAIDAKYKSLVDRRVMPHGDAYQMLAYCIALGIPRGFLVYAKESREQVADYEIKRHGYVVSVRAVDVELEPEALLAQVDELAAEIAATPSLVQAA
jgi:5-methylcytosine-specific restriction enzyme subunit McrC